MGVYKDLRIELYTVSLYRVYQEFDTLSNGVYYVLLLTLLDRLIVLKE